MKGFAAVLSLMFGVGSLQAEAEQRQGLTHLCIKTDTATYPIKVEIAVTPTERAQGLMGRKSLAPDQGMLFVYNYLRSPDATFWMRNTLIPLDIAYLSPDGNIRAIETMTPCRAEQASDCQRYPAGVNYMRALEMNAGFFADKGIEPGDSITRNQQGSSCSR